MSAIVIAGATLAMSFGAVLWWRQVMTELRTTRLALVDRVAVGMAFASFLLASVAWCVDLIAGVFP